ncbi:MAG TPA: alkaline phosphatase family protein [Terriglobales bacterium]|nr:alkaline phosphatase family protein [Terriglobales bacterium]
MKLAAKTLLFLTSLGATFAYAQNTKFQHVVVIVQENRTPDNLFQDPLLIANGADIVPFGNSKGRRIRLQPVSLVTCYDLDHAHGAFKKMFDRGKMDGAGDIRVISDPPCHPPKDPQFSYVDNSTGILKPYWDMAEQYGFANRMFQNNQGPSFPAHQFLLSGTSAPSVPPDRYSDWFVAENPKKGFLDTGCTAPQGEVAFEIDPTGKESPGYAPPGFNRGYPCYEHATLTDLLDSAGINWKYYSWTARSIWTAPNAIKHMCQPSSGVCTSYDWTHDVVLSRNAILKDIKNNNCNSLASVSWVIPDGTWSDHANLNKGLGPSWVGSIVNAIGQSKCGYWRNTAILITWDDWGGWYDHVEPPQPFRDQYEMGFRVPLLVVSAYTPKGYISNVPHDFGSILHFIEVVFGPSGSQLGPIPPGTYADTTPDYLQDFFPRNQKFRKFHRIPVAHGANYFIHYAGKPRDPDNDANE